jgi:signal transduction histidine kinase
MMLPRARVVLNAPIPPLAPAGPRHWQGLTGSMRVRILAAVVVLLVGSSAVALVLLRSVLLERLDEEIAVGLQRETEEFQLLGAGRNPDTGQPFGDDLGSLFDVYFAREVPDEGETIIAFLGAQLYRAEAAPDAVPPEELGGPISYWLTLRTPETGMRETPAGEARYSAVPLAGRDGPGLLMVVNFPRSERAEINAAVATQALIQFGTIVLAALIGLAMAGRVLRPLGALADTAQTISGTDLTRRIPVRGKDEASRIASAFNDMLGRLERAFTTQREFLDDANHELRAPLTVIRGHVELLDLLPDADERRATITLIVGEIERMNRIVDELLLLARSERPGFLSVEPLDLAALTREMHRKAAVLCEREWVLAECAPAVVEADGQRLTQAMVQLAENACQHTPPGSPVRIGSRVTGGYARLWMHDSGAGVPEADRQRIFQRFVKGSEHAGGSGLGLSIVAAIADAHGGYAHVAPTSEPGARFEIVVPLRQTPLRREPAHSGLTSAPAPERTASSSSRSANGLRR